MTHSNYGRFSVDADWNKLAKGRGYDDRWFEDNWGLYQDPRDKSGNLLRDQRYYRNKHGTHSWSPNRSDKHWINQTYTVRPDQEASYRRWLEENRDNKNVKQKRGSGHVFRYEDPDPWVGRTPGGGPKPVGPGGPSQAGGPGQAGRPGQAGGASGMEQVGGGGYYAHGGPSQHPGNRGGPPQPGGGSPGDYGSTSNRHALAKLGGGKRKAYNKAKADITTRRGWWRDMVEDKGRSLYQSLQTQWAAKNAYRQAKEYRATGWGY